MLIVFFIGVAVGLWVGLTFGARYGMMRLGQSELRGRLDRIRRR